MLVDFEKSGKTGFNPRRTFATSLKSKPRLLSIVAKAGYLQMIILGMIATRHLVDMCRHAYSMPRSSRVSQQNNQLFFREH